MNPEAVAVNMKIAPLEERHYKEVARIYREGLETGIASFETEVPDWKTWNNKFSPNCRLVALEGKRVIGWCALSPVSKREVYKGVAEVTIYIDSAYRGKGVGRDLLESLINASEQAGYWSLQAGIFPENDASLKLHKKCGFRVVGIRERPAQRHGVWYDNVLLERRSTKIGLN